MFDVWPILCKISHSTFHTFFVHVFVFFSPYFHLLINVLCFFIQTVTEDRIDSYLNGNMATVNKFTVLVVVFGVVFAFESGKLRLLN